MDKCLQWVGSGAFGHVYRGVYGTREAAFKYIPFSSDRARKSLATEVYCLSRLSPHPNVITLFEHKQTNDEGMLVVELCGRCLFDVVTTSSWNLIELRKCFSDVANGIQHIHSHFIVHRDLKLENVMFKSDGTACIIDFGLAHIFSSAHETTLETPAGSWGYAPPEVLLQVSTTFDAYAADIWSLGILYVAMHHGHLPFQSARISDPRFARFRMTQQLGLTPSEGLMHLDCPIDGIHPAAIVNGTLHLHTRASAKEIHRLAQGTM